MKEFIINHISIISSIVGFIIFIVALNLFSVVEGTKFEILHKSYFVLMLVIGVLVSSEAIGKWLVK